MRSKSAKKVDIRRQLVRLFGAILICQGAGVLGGIFTSSSVATWYKTLEKPVFQPPAWLFGPVWLLLYSLMGLSLYRAVFKKAKLKWFFIQLILNVLWSYLFFGRREVGLAFLEILVLLGAIVATINDFKKKDMLAAKLLLPYLAWVSFAAVLNFSIWKLN